MEREEVPELCDDCVDRCEGYEGDLGECLAVTTMWGCIECVEKLIVRGADVNNRDHEGDTPLHEAAFKN